jgi:hypothetical protein
MTAGGGLKWEALSLARWTGEEGAQEAARTHRPTRGRILFTIPDAYRQASRGASRRFLITGHPQTLAAMVLARVLVDPLPLVTH